MRNPMPKPKTVSALLAATLLAGCAALQPPPQPVTYACAGGSEFTITFLRGDAGADIFINRMRFHLRQEPAASGVRYACDVLTFTGKGNEAQVEMDGSLAYHNCRALR